MRSGLRPPTAASAKDELKVHCIAYYPHGKTQRFMKRQINTYEILNEYEYYNELTSQPSKVRNSDT